MPLPTDPVRSQKLRLVATATSENLSQIDIHILADVQQKKGGTMAALSMSIA
jgi:hypothetical protein